MTYCLPAAALQRLGSPAAFADASALRIVAATYATQTAEETPASVTVVTRKTSEQQQSVQDLLRGLPGV